MLLLIMIFMIYDLLLLLVLSLMCVTRDSSPRLAASNIPGDGILFLRAT